MADRTRSNNLLAAHAVMFLALAAALFCPWGTFHADPGASFSMNMPSGLEDMSFNFSNMPLTMTGTNGQVGFLGVNLPNWLDVLIAAAAVVLLALNTREITSLPRWILLLLFAVPGLYSVTGMIVLGRRGSISAGIVLLFIVCVAGLVLSLRSPDKEARAC